MGGEPRTAWCSGVVVARRGAGRQVSAKERGVGMALAPRRLAVETTLVLGLAAPPPGRKGCRVHGPPSSSVWDL